jgi:hypothetical protein
VRTAAPRRGEACGFGAGKAADMGGAAPDGSGDSMPGFSCCMCRLTPNASTRTAAMETGAAKRRAADGLASTARREAARIAGVEVRVRLLARDRAVRRAELVA